MWYLLLRNEIGRWHTTKEAFSILLIGIKDPRYTSRWNYFKAFMRAFYRGFKIHKPLFLVKKKN